MTGGTSPGKGGENVLVTLLINALSIVGIGWFLAWTCGNCK
ncbi:MAG: hypothetical protein ACHQ6T_04740 [Myxococcota bacterium]